VGAPHFRREAAGAPTDRKWRWQRREHRGSRRKRTYSWENHGGRTAEIYDTGAARTIGDGVGSHDPHLRRRCSFVEFTPEDQDIQA
jgi:hypothetical protein